MVTLDVVSFPGVVDEIWREMPVDGAVVALEVSRDWRRRAKALLQRHVYAHRDSHQGARVHVRDPNKPTTECDPSHPSWFVSDEVVEVLAGCPTALLFVLPNGRALEELFENIRCMDLVGWDFANDICPLVLTLERRWALRTARVILDYHSEEVCPEANTTVYFSILEGHTKIRSWHARNVVLNLEFLASPGSQGLYRSLWGWFTILESLNRPNGLDSLVLIYRNPALCSPGAFNWVTLAGEAMCAKWAIILVDYLVWFGGIVPEIPMKLVGLETFFVDSHAFQLFKSYFLMAVYSRRVCAGVPWDSWHGLQVLTHTEYEALVGPETYRLYSVQ